MNVLGVDPGQSGAWAIIDDSGRCIDMDDLPYVSNMLDPIALKDAWSLHTDGLCAALEEPLCPRTSGTTTAMQIGKNYGLMKSVVIFSELPYVEVRPDTWKRDMKVTGGGKELSIALALQLFPDQREKLKGPRGKWLDGRAEALLIAEWKRRKEMKS